MNPETITTSQILKSLTPKHVATIVSTTIAVCAAIAYGGFWVGQQIAESKSLVQQAELRAATAQVQAKLEVAQAQLQASVAASAQMKELLERSQKTVEDKNNEIAKLNEALGRSNNCAFVHQQIIDTKREMEGTGSMIVFSADAEWQEKQRIRRAMLEQRLSGYQQQLGTCNK
jgi:Rad3-related DNA helicase